MDKSRGDYFTALELLPRNSRTETDLDAEHARHRRARRDDNEEGLLPRHKTWREASSYIWILLAVALVVVPLVYASQRSEHFGETGCLPNGNFALPYTHTIWDPTQFLSITMGFTGGNTVNCGNGNDALSGYSYNYGPSGSTQPGYAWQDSDAGCIGYTFGQVKAIDVAFDVLVGRGGQLALTVLAYRLFSEVLTSLMREGEVGYEAFSAVAFQTGSIFSLWLLLKHAIWKVPVPRTPRARWLYCAMGLSTLYILLVPTLVSAMTGYTPTFVPYIQNVTQRRDEELNTWADPQTAFVDCSGKLEPVWGILDRPPRGVSNSSSLGNTLGELVHYEKHEPDWADYIERYQSIYDSCYAWNLEDCPAAQIDTWVMGLDYDRSMQNYTIAPPVIGATGWPVDGKRYKHWSCNELLVVNKWLHGYDDAEDLHTETVGVGFTDLPDNTSISSVGFCMAGNAYAWGFSFLLTLCTCLLNLLFTILMYGIWFNLRRHSKGQREPSHSLFKDVLTMAFAAQEQHTGRNLAEWPTPILDRDVLRGKRGMTMRRSTKIERRSSMDDIDPRTGIWGG